MPSPTRPFSQKLAGATWQRLERILEEFEKAWQQGGRPALRDYLIQADEGERPALLLELVHEDLEFRIRAGEPARVEHFLADYPRLRQQPEAVHGLIVAEYQARQARGDAVDAQKLRERFPDLPCGLVEDGAGLRMPGTMAEMRRISADARTSLKVEPLTRSGREASVAALLTDLSKARYAHLATHGFFADASVRSALQVDPEQFRRLGTARAGAAARSPLVLSGLVLAGDNRKGAEVREAILTAEGIVGLNFEGMDLAVLSACETGLGEVAGGEGVLGLVRAFHVAGCKDVVASLWRVDDEATAALMGRFYHKLWAKKQPPLEALRQAQLEVYRNPGLIKDWAKRDFDLTETPAPRRPATEPTKSGERARTAQWAAFLLSGAGRH